MVEGEVYRFHAGIVAGGVGDAVIASDFVAGLGAQFFFQYTEEGIEKTQVQPRAVADDVADFFVRDVELRFHQVDGFLREGEGRDVFFDFAV